MKQWTVIKLTIIYFRLDMLNEEGGVTIIIGSIQNGLNKTFYIKYLNSIMVDYNYCIFINYQYR